MTQYLGNTEHYIQKILNGGDTPHHAINEKYPSTLKLQ